MLRFFLAGLLLAALMPRSADAVAFDLTNPTTRPFIIGVDVSDQFDDDPNDPNTFPPLDGNVATTGGPYNDFCLGDASCPTVAFMADPTTWVFLHAGAVTEALVNAGSDPTQPLTAIPGTFASPGFEAGSTLNPFPVNAIAYFVDTVTGHMTNSVYGVILSSLGELGFQAGFTTGGGPWNLPENLLRPPIPMPAVTIGNAGDEGGFSRGTLLGVLTQNFFCTKDPASVPPPPGFPACDDPNEPLSGIAGIHPFDPLTGEVYMWGPVKATSLDDPNDPNPGFFLLATSLGDLRFKEIPEPTSVLLLGAGLVGLAFLRRRSA